MSWWPWSSDTRQILQSIELLKGEMRTHMASIKDTLALVEAKVTETLTVEEGAKTLLEELAQIARDMAENGATAEQLQSFADRLDAGKESLAAAIVANTPSAAAGAGAGS
jgi:chromosome segregation ATPase